MSAIWKEYEIKWKGRTYHGKPSFNFMMQLEQIAPATELFIKAMEERIKSTEICRIIAVALKNAGVDVSVEDVFEDKEIKCGLSAEAKQYAFSVLLSFATTDDEEESKKKEVEPTQEEEPKQ